MTVLSVWGKIYFVDINNLVWEKNNYIYLFPWLCTRINKCIGAGSFR